MVDHFSAWRGAIALYLVAAAVLLLPWPFGAHPDWAYNWEGYTAWRWATYWEAPNGPSPAILAPTDGLMTDSGQGPLIGLPIAIGVAIGGVTIDSMRIPIALLSAAAVPVFWFLGRRVFGTAAATMAALLLATSPVFLVYGRTATLVGVSVLPLLLSTLALLRVLDADPTAGWRWHREGALIASLVLGIYAYAPVRLVWPLAVAILGIAALTNPARRAVLLRTSLLCLAVVPMATVVVEALTSHDPDPIGAATGYFHARGEQLLAMSGDPAAAGQYVRRGEGPDASGWDTALQLIFQNAGDLVRLLLDRDTGPAPVDYWNESGRFWPWFLLPFAIVGALAALRRYWSTRDRIAELLPVLFVLGLTLPLFLTSRVHIGRLLPALPFALLLAAAGVAIVSAWLEKLAQRLSMDGAARWTAPLLAVLLFVPAAASARIDMEAPLSPSRESRTVDVLANWHAEASQRGDAVLIEDPALGDDIERVHAATYRLELDKLYRFVDVRAAVADKTIDPRPTLLWRGTLRALEMGGIARPCQRLWFVAPEIAAEFVTTWRGAGCDGAPDSIILP